VVLKKSERSEPPLKSRDSASLVFNKERFAKIYGSSLRSRSFSTTPLASFLGSLPLLSQEGKFVAGVLIILLLIRPVTLDAQVIAAGQTIQVKLQGQVTTKSARVGDAVTARVDNALKDGRGIVIPAGTRLVGRVDFVQRKSTSEDGWMRLLFNRFELADGRAVDTLATASFHHDRPRGMKDRVLTVGMFAGIGALIVGKTKRVAGGLGGAIVGVVLTENRNRFGRDLTLRSGRTIDLKLSDNLPAPTSQKF